MKILLPLSLLLLAQIPAFGQNDVTMSSIPDNDSIHFQREMVNFMPQKSIIGNTPLMPDNSFASDSLPSSFMKQRINYHPLYTNVPTDGANPPHFGNFQLTGFLYSNSFPGLMDVESGSLGLLYKHGRVSAYAGGIVNKYAFFRGMHTQKGVTGNFSYQFSPQLSATVFGTYYWGQPMRMANGAPMLPGMLGFYNVCRFGGYVDYQFSPHFGMQVGAQAVEQAGPVRTHSQYEVEPIATPYVKVGNVAIGLPVGQILNGIIRDNIERHRR